jgi:hypothetical protein
MVVVWKMSVADESACHLTMSKTSGMIPHLLSV